MTLKLVNLTQNITQSWINLTPLFVKSAESWPISGSLLTRNGVWPQWTLFQVTLTRVFVECTPNANIGIIICLVEQWIMTFNVQKKVILIHRFWTVGEGPWFPPPPVPSTTHTHTHTQAHTPPAWSHFAPSLWPPVEKSWLRHWFLLALYDHPDDNHHC